METYPSLDPAFLFPYYESDNMYGGDDDDNNNNDDYADHDGDAFYDINHCNSSNNNRFALNKTHGW